MQNPLIKFIDFLEWTWHYTIRPHHHRLLGVITALLIAAAVPLTVFLAQKEQDIRQRAATGTPGLCRDLKPSETIPTSLNGQDNLYKWVAVNQCSQRCTTNAECPKNTSDSYIDPNSSNWCYGFEGSTGTSADWRCLQLTYIGPRTTPTATPVPTTATCGATHQTPDLGPTCTTCIANTSPSLVNDIKNLNPGPLGACSTQQLITMWCNNGISQQATDQCTVIRNGTCASACGGTPPTVSPTTTVTITPSVTTTPGATATIAPGSVAFSFTIILEGIGAGGGNQSPANLQRRVSVELFDQSDQIVGIAKSGILTYDAASKTFKGTVDMGPLAIGSYSVKVKVNRYLKRRISSVISISSGISTYTIPQTRLFIGDVNGDNKLDIVDYNILRDCGYGAITPRGKGDSASQFNSPACRNQTTRDDADLDDNVVIDAVDYNYFLHSLSVGQGD